MSNFKWLFFTSLFFITSIETSRAQSPPGLTAPMQRGYVIVQTFNGPSGLTGWLMKGPKDLYSVFWTTPDGMTMIDGSLVNDRGEDLTQLFQERYAPRLNLAGLWAQLDKSTQIISHAEGGGRDLYVFLDPSCPYCHILWLALRPYETAGSRIHWIVVGFLHGDSSTKAAAILAAPDKSAALIASQQTFKSGGIAPLTSIPESIATGLERNLEIMRSFGFVGVPALVYMDSSGAVRTKSGVPKLTELPKMLATRERRSASGDVDLSPFE
jgi:thiol:disulfide interchange protein DsbG